MKLVRTILSCLLWLLYTINVQSITNLLDNANISWTKVNSTNGATFEELYANVLNSPSSNTGGIAVDFTEDITYNITTSLFVNGMEYLAFSTSPGVEVTFNIPKEITFIEMNMGILSINGNFVFQGVNQTLKDLDDPSSLSSMQVSINFGMAYIEGATFQNFVASQGVINNNIGTLNIDSVLFRNNIGTSASSIMSNAGTILLNNVTVENSSVISWNTTDDGILEAGGQIYMHAGALYLCDSTYFENNNGKNLDCIDGQCDLYSTTFCNDNQIKWTEINSIIAPTFEDFYALVSDSITGQASGAYQFTESINYTVTAALSLTQGMLYLSTACGVTVIFNLPSEEISYTYDPSMFIQIALGGPFVNITGDFIVQRELPATDSSTLSYIEPPISISDAYAYIEGLTLQNFAGLYQGVINTADAVLGLKDITFNNITSGQASALYSFDSAIILSDIIIKNCNVNVTSDNGAQIYIFDVNIYGGNVFVENNFPSNATDNCNNDCYFSVIDGINTDSNAREYNCIPNSTDDDNNNNKITDDNDDNTPTLAPQPSPSPTIKPTPSPVHTGNNAGKVAAIVIPLVLVFCCAGGGIFMWLLQQQKSKKRKQPLLQTTHIEDGNTQNGSMQSKYQQF